MPHVYTDVCKVLTSQVKFIVDTFVFRVFYRYHSSELVCEIYQGEYRFSEDTEAVYAFERYLMSIGLPATFEDGDLRGNQLFANTVFENGKIVVISALPIAYTADNQILITVASKQKEHSLSIDFRFIKLIGELIANKLFQLKLMGNIAAINQDLNVKNNEINSLNKNLSRMVAERTKELNEANKELTTLFYRTSHDFRAPLANIMGLANVAPLITDDNEALKLFEQCRQVAEGMAGMLTKLNFLTENFEQGWQHVNFKAFLSALEQKHRRRLEECEGRMTTETTQSANCYANVEILNIAFDCLIDNSITYREQPLHIHIKVVSKNGFLIIKVADNGPGIHKKIRSKIFDMYYRGNSNSQGQGLGLYITRKILKSINAEITLSSADKLTSFIIKIPI